MEKIKFNISQLDEKGMIGSSNGKRFLSYEFCIPNNAKAKEIIMDIDTSIQFVNSPGRIGCTQSQLLCIGESNEDIKQVLKKLVKLEFVVQIEQTFFE